MEIAKKVKVVIINAKRFAVSVEIRKFAVVTVRTCRLSGCFSPAPEPLETPLRSALRRRVKRNAWSANVPATSSSNNHKMKLKHLLFTFISFLTFAGFHTAEAQKKSVGDATYYSHRLQGRRTSDGSLYHRDSLTCAHRTLPFGTLLKVRNTVNGREVVVKVTDRGPFRRGGIVDLSYAAAERIGLVRRGVVRVEVEAVGTSAYSNTANQYLANVEKNDILPELQLLDPTTGKYYTMTDWLKLGKEAREKAKASAAQHRRAAYLAQNKVKRPVWRVVEGKTTAKAE